MNQPTRTRHLSGLTSSDRPAFALRLVIGCLIASTTAFRGQATSAEPSPVQPVLQPTVKPTVKPAATSDPIVPVPVTKKLLGQWLTKEPLDGDTVMLVFAPDGKAFILTGTAASGNAIATPLQYRLDAKPQPMHLDLVLSADATVETLFEITADGDLRLQMLGTRPGKPRPAELTSNATLFQKISDDTTPPSGTEIKPLHQP